MIISLCVLPLILIFRFIYNPRGLVSSSSCLALIFSAAHFFLWSDNASLLFPVPTVWPLRPGGRVKNRVRGESSLTAHGQCSQQGDQ